MISSTGPVVHFTLINSSIVYFTLISSPVIYITLINSPVIHFRLIHSPVISWKTNQFSCGSFHIWSVHLWFNSHWSVHLWFVSNSFLCFISGLVLLLFKSHWSILLWFISYWCSCAISHFWGGWVGGVAPSDCSKYDDCGYLVWRRITRWLSEWKWRFHFLYLNSLADKNSTESQLP